MVALAASQLRADTRIGPGRLLAVLVDGVQNAMPVALACATVGIVVDVVATTRPGVKVASGIVGMALGSLLITLVLTMIAARILGTGLPTSATDIITSIMATPALVQLGLPRLVAHRFVFYFGILADLTPPTAISTYATSSIAGADVWRTQRLALTLSLSGFIIPFSFAYDPALLLINASVRHIVRRTAAATLGIFMLGAGLIGYLAAPTTPWPRVVLLAGAVLLIFPGVMSNVLGAAGFVTVLIAQRRHRIHAGAGPRSGPRPSPGMRARGAG